MNSCSTPFVPAAVLVAAVLIHLPIRAAPESAKPPDAAAETSRSLYQLESSVISAGGALGTTPQHQLNGSVGQPAPIGAGSNVAYLLYAGFWYLVAVPDSPTATSDLLPLVNQLDQNVPNPFNPQTTISFQVAQPDVVHLEVFDLAGRRVRTLVHEMRPPGRHDVVWDGKDDGARQLPSNLYLLRLQIGRFEATRKMLLLK